MLYIRADGNSTIGLGHIMRCLSIADELKRLGQDTTFFVADANPVVLIENRGYHVLVLDSDYRNMEQELEKLVKRIKQENSTFLLVDSYFVSQKYFQELKRYVSLAYMDDYGKEAFAIDVLINYNIYGPRLPYEKLYGETGKNMQFLLGSSYAPLRRDFQCVPYQVREKVENVLVTTGGADTYNVAGKFLEKMLEQDQDTVYHVISGPFHTFHSQLEEIAQSHLQIIIHENVTQMAALMQTCDVAISAAGSTLYELCSIGVPTIYFCFVENQELPAQYFEKDTQMIYGGNYVAKPEETLKKLVEHTKQLLTSYEKRVGISQSMGQVTDGSGAERIAKCLKDYLS